MWTELLTNNCNECLKSIDSLWFEGNPTVNIGSVEILVQRCVETLRSPGVPLRWEPPTNLDEPESLDLLCCSSP
jgi:hypothetical protein